MSHDGWAKSSASASGINSNVRRDEATEMVLPADQVKQFMSSMQEFSDNCSRSGEAVETALEASKKKEAETVKNMKKMVGEVTEMKRDISKAIGKQEEDIAQMREQFETFEDRGVQFGKKCGEVRRILERVEAKETMMCSFVDSAKESERVIRALYTRSMYAGTISREIATASLNSLEAAIRLVRTQAALMKNHGVDTNIASSDDMIDTGSEGACSSGNKNSVCSLIDDILFKIRFLKNDVQTVDRAAELMMEVDLLDKTLRVASGEIRGVCVDHDDVQEQRKRVECIVRLSMEYNTAEHGTKAEFEQLVSDETDKRMRSCGVDGASLMSDVMSTLKKNPPPTASAIPVHNTEPSGCGCASSSTRRA